MYCVSCEVRTEFIYVQESRQPLLSSGQSSWLQNWDTLCFLWGTNWIYVSYVEESRPPLWPSGQSSWLQIQKSWFDSRRYQIFLEVVGLERGPLSLVSTIEELLERKSSGSGLENREYGRKNPSHWLRGTLCQQKLSLTSSICGDLSVGVVRSRTQARDFYIHLFIYKNLYVCPFITFYKKLFQYYIQVKFVWAQVGRKCDNE
jgi:hypothetical protein